MNINSKISNHLAFLIVLVGGLVVALVTIRIGENIIGSTHNSASAQNKLIQEELERK